MRRDSFTFDLQELQKREADCTRHDPPQCILHCPIGVDVRSLCQWVAKGEFNRGLSLLQKATPFVRLIARACEAPCEGACILQKTVGGVEIGHIERACVQFGKPSKRRFMLPKKTQSVALVGDDLLTLASAVELGLKGYTVTTYTTHDNWVDVLRTYGLDEDEARADLAICDSLKFRYEPLPNEALPSLVVSYDAVYVENEVDLMPSNCFRAVSDGRMIGDLGLAKQVALAIDHYLQGVVSEERIIRKQPLQESRLFVSPRDIEAAKPALPLEDTEENAMHQADRCIQCRCEECIRSCVFLQHYEADPRKSIREIYNNLSIVIGTRQSNTMINSCAMCNQCTVRCPNDFDMVGVIAHARETMVEKGNMPPSTHEFAMLDMQFSNEESFFARPAPDGETKYLFFPGCQATSVSPDTVRHTFDDLAERLGGVGILSACCGAIADWAGRKAEYEEMIARLRSEWETMGQPEIIAACPTCRNILAHELKAKVTGIWEVLERIGIQADSAQKGPVTLHDACGARGDAETQQMVRKLLRTMGYDVKEGEWSGDETACCGWGGLVSYANPEVAGKMASFCTSEANEPYVSYCMGCRDRFAKAGASSRHLLELVYGDDEQKTPDISDRRYNRYRLKKEILEEVYAETMETRERDYHLVVSEEVRETLDRRMILLTDLYDVIDQMQETGDAIKDDETGEMLTRARLGNVTFWVNYADIEGGYEVKSAYSHRMTIEVL